MHLFFSEILLFTDDTGRNTSCGTFERERKVSFVGCSLAVCHTPKNPHSQ
jgi:hypothetical protein